MSAVKQKIWETPYRLAFVRVVEEYMQSEGINREEAARRFKIGHSTLHQMLSNQNRHRPGDDLLKRVASTIGCDLALFTPIPGKTIPGIGKEQMQNLSTAKQLVMHMLYQHLSSDFVSDEQAMGMLNILVDMLKLTKLEKN